MALDPSIVEAVANSNFKAMSELAIQNTLGHQQRLQILAEKALAKSLEAMDTVQSTEMDATSGAAIAQILSKLAQTTRPETGGG